MCVKKVKPRTANNEIPFKIKIQTHFHGASKKSSRELPIMKCSLKLKSKLIYNLRQKSQVANCQ